MTLSEKLYSLRRKQGLSQEALAEKLDCSRQVISKWENGTTTPDAEMLQKYSELFGVSIDYLVKEDALSDYQLICMTRSNKSAIAEFKKSKNAVLFASGAMWEGVDCAGDGLSSVIIARLPFPLRSATMEQKKDKYSSVTEFVRKVAVPEMIIKLRQGVGRLIRNETDTGLVAVLDARAYSGANAGKVQDVLKKYTRVRSTEDIRKFFRDVKSDAYFESI